MTTLDIYAHVLPAMDQDVADRIGAGIHDEAGIGHLGGRLAPALAGTTTLARIHRPSCPIGPRVREDNFSSGGGWLWPIGSPRVRGDKRLATAG